MWNMIDEFIVILVSLNAFWNCVTMMVAIVTTLHVFLGWIMELWLMSHLWQMLMLNDLKLIFVKLIVNFFWGIFVYGWHVIEMYRSCPSIVCLVLYRGKLRLLGAEKGGHADPFTLYKQQIGWPFLFMYRYYSIKHICFFKKNKRRDILKYKKLSQETQIVSNNIIQLMMVFNNF